jgi:hypothetical protein
MNTFIQKIKSVGYIALGYTVLHPKIVAAQILVPIVPNCNTSCGWNDLIQVGQNVIQDAVVFVAMAAVLSITYAGYLYATAGGSDSQIKKAHEVFGKVVWGIFFTLGAWLLVYTILDWMEVEPEFTK